MSVFVSTSGPEGWTLGRWTATSIDSRSWEERKPDGTSYQFEAVGSSSTPSSSTVRLRMVGTTTEAMLLESTAQIFVDGRYFGEYGGHWEQRRASTSSMRVGSKASVAASEFSLPPLEDIEEPEVFLKAPPPTAPAGPERDDGGLSQIDTSPAKPKKAPDLDRSAEKAAALVMATRKGLVDEVRRLLETVDPDATQDGWSALLVAAEQGNKEIVELLLEAGADPNILKDGSTPMQLAFKSGNQEVFKILFALAFQTLDSAVAGSGQSRPMSPTSAAKVSDDEIPETALNDLRDMTRRLANAGKHQESAAIEIPDYAEVMSQEESDKVREETIKETMKLIARATTAA
mmetsp:Transcript_38924/g.70228  ORF Transcript_38924/g.70228 Transcript_38924/m.70228 type:complete len:346 (-) Transcript_38924:71-1108(-)